MLHGEAFLLKKRFAVKHPPAGGFAMACCGRSPASLARGAAIFGALPACPRRRCVTAQPLARMPLRDARQG